MDPNAQLRAWTPRLLFFAVTATLVLIGAIQYQWFSRSAAVEIEGTFKGLEFSLRQTVVREFQRYAPVVAELEALKAGTVRDTALTRMTLDRILASYGPQGTVSGLMSWAGLWEPGSPWYFRSNGAGTWTSVALPETRWAYELREQTPPADLGAENVILYRTGAGGPTLLLSLNVESFFRSYVFAALAEAFPGAGLSWSDQAGDLPPPAGFDRRTYAFNPFTALFTGGSLSRVLEVGIPKLIDVGGRSGGGKSDPGAPPPAFRVFASWVIQVTLPADAPVLGVETRLAWNWLGGVLLLVGLGLAFGLVLLQSDKIATLRRTEREFVASVSHELRTPLTVIRSAADNFARGIVAPGRQIQYGQLILDQSVRLGRMIEEMLAFAQTEAAPPQSRVRATLTFASWLAELRPPLDTLAAARAVNLEWDVAGVPAAGTTDPDILRLVLENLVVNAVNHAYPAPGPGALPRPVRITLRYLVPDRLELTVDDDGRGIAPKEARKVFEPFYRDKVSRDNQEKGSGLGLFLALRQIRRMGGELKLETPWRRLDGVRRPGCRFRAVVPFEALVAEVPDGR